VVNIRVTHRPNLNILLSPTGLEAYTEKRARIDALLRAGEQEEIMGQKQSQGEPEPEVVEEVRRNEHGGVIHMVAGTVGVGSGSENVNPEAEETEPTEEPS
jgi:hypothetical protein